MQLLNEGLELLRPDVDAADVSTGGRESACVGGAHPTRRTGQENDAALELAVERHVRSVTPGRVSRSRG